MSKICLITDLHFGARNASTIILDHQELFYKTCFIPYLDDNKIDTVICLGDTFDSRKYTNNYVINQCKRMLFDELQSRNIQIYMIVGNHDSAFRNTVSINTVELLLCEYDNVIPISEPKTVTIHDTDIFLTPWLCQDNSDSIMDEMRKTSADICMGHWEIQNFLMYRGTESHGGLPQATFNKFAQTFSGHYHHRSTQNSITYLGTPYELTWQDYGDAKGFHVFDLQSRELTFIENPNKLFHKIEYDDLDTEPVDISKYDLKGAYIKIIVVNKTDYYKFDVFLNKIYAMGCADVKIVEDITDYGSGELSEDVRLEDTQSVLNHYIDSIETDIELSSIKSYIQSLYTEAVNLESA